MCSTKRIEEITMKIYCKRSFKLAQEIAREAVAEGSKAGYDFDWSIAMIYLKVATGHASIEEIERLEKAIEAAQ